MPEPGQEWEEGGFEGGRRLLLVAVIMDGDSLMTKIGLTPKNLMTPMSRK